MNRRTLCQSIAAIGIAAIPGRFSAQAALGNATPQSASGNDSVCGQAVSLRLHETVTTDAGLSIRLGEIKDHRCSQDVECVWAGYAEIRLDLSGPDWEDRGYPATESFTIGMDDWGVRRYGSFVLILDSLSPTPRPSVDTPLDAYKVGLVLIELSPH